MATTEFIFNDKIHTVIKLSLFKINYGKELRMDFKIRKKRKYVKVEEFLKEMKKIHKEVKVTLKIYTNKNRKEVVKYKMGDRMLLSIKKLIEKFMEPYKIK